MQRKLLATVAAAPLLAMATTALAEVTITTSVSTPATTAAASSAGPDSVRVTSAGSINLKSGGPAITLNSSHNVTNEGNIATTAVNDSGGILVLGGNSGTVKNTGGISLLDDYTATDTDSDGDIDGPIAQGSGRYGIRVTGPGVFTGDIINTGSLSTRGADARGIDVLTEMNGAVNNSGIIVVLGDRAKAMSTTAKVVGDIISTGSITAQGDGAVGMDIGADVGGQIRIQSNITAYGYRYTERFFYAEDRAKLDADDKLQSGSALRVSGNVGKGVLLDGQPLDLIPDDGKADTTTDSDENGNGIADNLEGVSNLVVYGSAPVVNIGSDTQAITLGVNGTGDYAYGLINRGTITSNGVYDGVSSTGVLIGGSTGKSTVITNGFRNSGSISATAFEADATGVRLTAGAQVDTFNNAGTVSATTTSEGDFSARGLLIEQGASMTNLVVGGALTASVAGEKGSAIAIEDRSGTLRTITNNLTIGGLVSATDDANDKDDADIDPGNEVVTGKSIAIDVRAATGGVTIKQIGLKDGDDGNDGIADVDTDGDGVDDNNEPTMFGAILLGKHDDVVDIQNGTVLSDISFGEGADILSISGGAYVTGSMTDSDGRLTINLVNGTLSITNPQPLQMTDLNVGSGGKLLVIADPQAGTATKLIVSGSAKIESGAQIGLTLKSVLDGPTRLTVIEAGSLTAGTINQNLLASAPYLYIAQASADQAAGKVYLDVRARTATELGFSKGQASAYNAVLASLKGDAGIQSAILSQTTRNGLVSLYDQLTPDTGEGMFAALETANQLMSQATANRPDPYDRYGPDSFWGQEINTLVRRESGDTQGSDAQVFGFMGGYESMSANGGALGVTLAYVNVEEHDSAAVVGEHTTASILQGGVYWRRAIGGLSLNAGVGGGYAWFDGTRRFIGFDSNADGAADVIRTNDANWTGATGSAFAGVSYQAMLGRFYARPEIRLDYLYLKEGERKESGGGSVLDLTVDGRAASSLSTEAAITFGANFGRDVWVRPELRIGYRQVVSGQLDDTVARFTGGTPFTIAAGGQDEGALTLNVALKSGTAMSYVGVEAGAEARKKQKRYNVRLNGRMMF